MYKEFVDVKSEQYSCIQDYGVQVVEYFFNCSYNMQRFQREIATNRDKLKVSLQKRFQMAVDCEILADLVLYRKVQPYGFYVKTEGEYFDTPKGIKILFNKG